MDLWDCIVELHADHGPALSQQFLALVHSDVLLDPNHTSATTRGGTVTFGAEVSALRGAASFRLGDGLLGQQQFELRREGDGFVLDVILVTPSFALPTEVRPAELVDGRLRPVGGADPARLVFPAATLRVDVSRADQPERYRFVVGAGDDVFEAQLDPGAVLLGDSGFGLELARVVVDGSETAAPGAPTLALPAEWTGLVVPEAKLHFPSSTTALVPEPIELEIAVGDDGSVRAHGEASWPPTATRPKIDVSVTVDDPFADSFLALVPTYARATVEFPAASTLPGVGAPLDTESLFVIATWTRTATPLHGVPPTVVLDVVATTDRADGLVRLRVGAGSGASPGKVAITAATLADVVLNGLFDGDGYAGLTALMGASLEIARHVDEGSFVLTRAEVTAGVGPLAARPELVVDYDAAVHFGDIHPPGFTLAMDETPFALAYRGVKVRPGGALGVELDYGDATVEIRSTGSWHVEPKSFPLQIPAVRFGQGSLWAEFDLDVAVELGPITVDRATLRVAIDPTTGFGDPELRGLGIHLDVPGALRVAGQARFAGDFLAASLSGYAGPGGKGFAVTAQFVMGGYVTGLAVAVTFPGPIPLANSGFGLFGAEGGFAVGARPDLADLDPDPVIAALKWKPDLVQARFWEEDASSFTFWLGLMLGTLPDAGFSLNAHARLAVAVPDLMFHLSLDGHLLALPASLEAAEATPVGDAGVSFLGVLQVSDAGVDVGLTGKVDLLPLLEVDVPVLAHFPPSGPAWYVRVGTDGGPGRPPGPVKVSLLPDLLGIYAFAFVMFEGAGVTDVGKELLGVSLPPTSSFTIAFGAGFDLKYGAPPFWLDVHGAIVAEVGTDPFLVAGMASIGGSLHLGPFSIGADATIQLLAGSINGHDVFWAQAHVCGSIDLWLTEIEGCVTIEIGAKEQPPITLPNPLVALSLMRPDGQVTPTDTDGHAAVVRTATDPVPTVWPDTIPTLAFSTMPATVWPAPPTVPPPVPPVVVPAGNVEIGPNSADGRTGSNDLVFQYRLQDLELVGGGDDAAAPVVFPGTMQLGKGTTDGRELAINTWSSSIWARALEDGGVTTGNPGKVTVDQCDPRYRARPGWALGIDGAGTLGSWRMPSERVETDPLRSMVSAHVEIRTGGTHVLEPSDLWSPPAGVGRVVAPHVERAPEGEHLASSTAERSFAGSLWLGTNEFPGLAPGRLLYDGYSAVITPTPLHDSFDQPVQLCLLIERGFLDVTLPIVTTHGQKWEAMLDDVDGLDDFLVATYVSDRESLVDAIEVIWGNGLVAILGLGGVTEAAYLEAERQTEAARERHRAVEALAAASATEPAGTPRILLDPGATYVVNADVDAVDVTKGSPVPVDPPDASRQFRIASDSSLPEPVTDWQIFNDESRFCPEYLRRYLHPHDPVTPADLTRFVFPKDDVMVSFWVEHTEQLAQLYEYDLHVRIRQVDAHPAGPVPPDPNPVDLAGVLPLPGGAPAFAVDVQVRDLLRDNNLAPEEAGVVRCHVPAAGTTKVIPAQLGCDGHYELRIEAVTDHVKRVIHTTTFATSLYEHPEDLLWELGVFDAAVAPASTRTTRRCWRDVVRTPAPPGDLAVDHVALNAGTQRGDHALDGVLTALGLAPWPRCTSARRWHLWVPPTPGTDAPWMLHGVLLEAPEPIVRPGRVQFGAARVGAVPLDAVITDDSGCRVVLLGAPTPPTAAPTAPIASLVLPVEEMLGGAAGSPVHTRSWTAAADVPVQPSFAHEVVVA